MHLVFLIFMSYVSIFIKFLPNSLVSPTLLHFPAYDALVVVGLIIIYILLLSLQASEGPLETSAFNSSAFLQIDVLEFNDHPPEFNQTNYMFSSHGWIMGG